MTSTNAELLLASYNRATGDTLYTWRLTFPRIILAEVNTHRAASKNTSSSRAIPAKKTRAMVKDDPFVPAYIGANQKGMQAGEELGGWRREVGRAIWSGTRYFNLAANWALEKLKWHKQLSNRLLEPWMWTVQIFSATDMKNFLHLRNHGMAEPHFHELAKQMQRDVDLVTTYCRTHKGKRISWRQAYPYLQTLEPGQWHLPLTTLEEQDSLDYKDLVTLSTARCAHTSYNQPGTTKVSTHEECVNLYGRLAGADPKHLSPTEHPAMAMAESRYFGNFKGFKQHRKFIPLESLDVTVLIA